MEEIERTANAPPREWVKNKNCRKSNIRDIIIENCIAIGQSKRQDIINSFRRRGGDLLRKQIISSSIQDSYHKRSNNGGYSYFDVDEDDSKFDILDPQKHDELVLEIEEAILLELELQEAEEYLESDYIYQEDFLNNTDNDNEHSIICPICRYSK